jgi:hypothetical protein
MNKKQGEKELIGILERKIKYPRYMKFPNKNGKIEQRECRILRYVIHKQSDNPDKYFVLDEIDWGKRQELRIGYYILGKKTKKVLGKWRWGQGCPMIPRKDLKTLWNKAKKRGLI